MLLSEKLCHLREVEGQMRGLGRALSKADLARLMRAELGEGVSQAYLSQLENGARVHLSAHTRDLLSRFFKVHPGYLVDDPPFYQIGLASAELAGPGGLRDWLAGRAEERRGDPLVYRVLLRLSSRSRPERYLALLDDLLDLDLEQAERRVREWRQLEASDPAAAGREDRGS